MCKICKAKFKKKKIGRSSYFANTLERVVVQLPGSKLSNLRVQVHIFIGFRLVPARLYFLRACYFALIFCLQIKAKSCKGRNGLVSVRLRYERGWITLHVYTAVLWNPVMQRGSFRGCITHRCHGQTVAETGPRARHCAGKKLNRTKFQYRWAAFSKYIKRLLASGWLKMFCPVESSTSSSRHSSWTSLSLRFEWTVWRAAFQHPGWPRIWHTFGPFPLVAIRLGHPPILVRGGLLLSTWSTCLLKLVNVCSLFYLIYGTSFNAFAQASYEKCGARTSVA